MKKSIIIVGLVLILVSAWTALDSGNQTLAVSGCCKTRASESDPWQKSVDTLESCKDLNQSEGDKVFKESGKVWWDLAC